MQCSCQILRRPHCWRASSVASHAIFVLSLDNTCRRERHIADTSHLVRPKVLEEALDRLPCLRQLVKLLSTQLLRSHSSSFYIQSSAARLCGRGRGEGSGTGFMSWAREALSRRRSKILGGGEGGADGVCLYVFLRCSPAVCLFRQFLGVQARAIRR